MSETEKKDYKEKIEESISESEGYFDKNLVYLSTGSLVLSIGFIEKITPLDMAKCKILLILSWVFLASTLLLNLFSFLISAHFQTKTRLELDQNQDTNKEYEKVYNDVLNQNRIVRNINWACFGLFSIGILILLVYCIRNIY